MLLQLARVTQLLAVVPVAAVAAAAAAAVAVVRVLRRVHQRLFFPLLLSSLAPILTKSEKKASQGLDKLVWRRSIVSSHSFVRAFAAKRTALASGASPPRLQGVDRVAGNPA